jgi:hypothetical protein
LKAFNSFLNIHVVTIEWLRQSLLQEKRLKEELFKPQEVKVDSTVHAVTSDAQKKRSRIVVKKTIFTGKTFAINQVSFNKKTAKDFEDMERVIISNGGVMIDSIEDAAFVIQEDGFDPNIWNKMDEEINYVHFRYIQECIAENQSLSHEDGIYLCPTPQALPVRAFAGITIETCLVTNQLDELVYCKLIELYGFKRGFRE